MNENVNVCITPKGDKPVLHFSQFDNENLFTVTVLADDGESAAVLTGLDIEFRLRKTDSHVVTIAPESVADNVITFKTTEQLCACCGQNIATVTLMKDDMVVSTLNILVDIQRDILSGGLTSESDIRNLTTQIEQIVPEVVGENYYDKQEVDELIAEHTFDPSNYYDKSDVDALLEDKADADDVYTKAETDNLLADKADKSAIASLIVQKDVAKAPIASFNTDLAEALTKIIVDINPVQSGTGTPSPSNVRPISGFSALNVTRTGVNLLNNSDKTITSSSYVINNVNVSMVVGSYILSFDFSGTSNSSSLRIDDENGTPVFTTSKTITNGHNEFLINLPSKASFVKLFSNAVGTYSKFQIERGNQFTTFEAYNGQTATVNFGQTVYSGVCDVTNGKVTITHGIVDLGTLSWLYNSTQQVFNAAIDDIYNRTAGTENDAICSNYAGENVWNASNLSNGCFMIRGDISRVYIKDTNYTDGATFKTAMSGVMFVYALATPIEIDTTPENLTAIVGQNNVYGDTNGDTAVRFTETIGNELGV